MPRLDKLDLLGGPTKNGTMRYRLSDMLRYLMAGADVVLDEGNTIKPEVCRWLARRPTPRARSRCPAEARADHRTRHSRSR